MCGDLTVYVKFFQNYVRSIRVCNPSAIDLNDELERDEIERWSNTLPQARVTRWGGMISTPDEYLQVRDIYLCNWHDEFNVNVWILDSERWLFVLVFFY
jgi:hypothetical protein